MPIPIICHSNDFCYKGPPPSLSRVRLRVALINIIDVYVRRNELPVGRGDGGDTHKRQTNGRTQVIHTSKKIKPSRELTFANSSGEEDSSWWVKSKRGGSELPLGRRVLPSLSSSKNGWPHPSKGLMRRSVSYASVDQMKSIASSGVFDRKTLRHWQALIWGNLNSV